MYQPTLPAYYFSMFSQNRFKYDHVGTCFCHKIPFSFLFQPVLGVQMAQYALLYLPKLRYISVYYHFSILLCLHKKNSSMNMKGHVGTCFCHKIPFSILFQPVLGLQMAQNALPFLLKLRYESAYITALLFIHVFTQKIKI